MMPRTTHRTTWILVALLALALVGPTACKQATSGPEAGGVEDELVADGGGAAGEAGEEVGAGDAEPEGVTVSNAPFPGAPPNVPHAAFGCTTNCLDCHGEDATAAPVSPHPERVLCKQCHLLQEDTDDWVANTFTANP